MRAAAPYNVAAMTMVGTGGAAAARGARLDDGRDELQQEARHAEQGGVEVVEEVHDEALDVRAVMVLVGHDHEVAVAQLPRAVVHLRGQSRAGL